MSKVLILQTTDVVKTDELLKINAYIEKNIKDGVLVLNKNITYEVVDVDRYFSNEK